VGAVVGAVVGAKAGAGVGAWDFLRRAHTYLTWVRARSWPESNMGLMIVVVCGCIGVVAAEAACWW